MIGNGAVVLEVATCSAAEPLCTDTIVAQGALIEEGAVVEAGSVVPAGARVPTKEVPASSTGLSCSLICYVAEQVWGGNPLKFVRKLDNKELDNPIYA